MALFTRDKNLLYPLSIFLLIFGLYALSAPRTVVLEDDGLFIMAAYFNGIAHPPGYPVYTLLGHLITYLPIGSIAYRVHLLSALFGALGCVALWSVLRRLKLEQFYAVLGSLALGLSGVYWSQAIIAEVYSLNVWLFLLLFILALRYAAEPSGRIIAIMGLLYGLSLSNHWPLLLLSTPMLLAVLWPRRLALLKQGLFAVPGLLLGLLPYLWLFIRSQMGPEISFYGPLDSWSDFWFFVSREGYSNADHSPSAGWWDKGQYMGFVLRESIQQVGLLGGLFCVWGFIRQWSVWPRTLCVGLLLGYLFNTLVLIGLLGFDYDLLYSNVFRVYPLIAYSILMIWLALGLQSVVAIASHYARPYLGRWVLAWGLGLVAIGTTGILNAKVNYRADDTWARDYAHTILETLPQGAILITSKDMVTGAVGYLRYVEAYRDDIRLYHSGGLVFSERLFHPYKPTIKQQRQVMSDLIRKGHHPVFFVGGGYGEKYSIDDYGIYQSLHDGRLPLAARFIAQHKIMDFYHDTLRKKPPMDPWSLMLYRVLTRDYCRFISSSGMFLWDENKERVGNILAANERRLCDNYYGLLEKLKLLNLSDKPDWQQLEAVANQAEMFISQAVTKSDMAELYRLKSALYTRTGDIELAESNLNKSLKAWSHPDNKAMGMAGEGIK